MKYADIQTAWTLIAQVNDINARLTAVSQAAGLQDITNVLTGLDAALQAQMLAQSRPQVTAFLQQILTTYEAQLAALNVTAT